MLCPAALLSDQPALDCPGCHRRVHAGCHIYVNGVPDSERYKVGWQCSNCRDGKPERNADPNRSLRASGRRSRASRRKVRGHTPRSSAAVPTKYAHVQRSKVARVAKPIVTATAAPAPATSAPAPATSAAATSAAATSAANAGTSASSSSGLPSSRPSRKRSLGGDNAAESQAASTQSNAVTAASLDTRRIDDSVLSKWPTEADTNTDESSQPKHSGVMDTVSSSGVASAGLGLSDVKGSTSSMDQSGVLRAKEEGGSLERPGAGSESGLNGHKNGNGHNNGHNNGHAVRRDGGTNGEAIGSKARAIATMENASVAYPRSAAVTTSAVAKAVATHRSPTDLQPQSQARGTNGSSSIQNTTTKAGFGGPVCVSPAAHTAATKSTAAAAATTNAAIVSRLTVGVGSAGNGYVHGVAVATTTPTKVEAPVKANGSNGSIAVAAAANANVKVSPPLGGHVQVASSHETDRGPLSLSSLGSSAGLHVHVASSPCMSSAVVAGSRE
jgi:hypothetical protein